ncbi:beta-Ala-His dipeptidase [Salinisphaera sp. USBA-960]|uniref:beta-Ala-His dipeptidase n=1 Tax=Salinisphaera orenii TaxID=856731 RepID=UPI000DBE5B57|nr:beta-Ala-His dipeptidase [Salifodinibacter halophilus]NNC25608.1 beta-Ala-His dipeptidase [Salifodinibacter halophilus]
MNEHLDELAPAALWRHFKTFCNTPRPSWHEEPLIQIIEQWADAQNLGHERDASNNLLIRKPATPGYENTPGIVLQGHLDMVAEAEPGLDHDFQRDPITTYTDDGWLKAHGTTLGADNGIGAAAALAILENDTLTHGPLEVLLTIAEEVSLVGASQLAENWLNGAYLLNLDTEQAGDVTIGCAGGAVVAADTELPRAPLADDAVLLNVAVDGLTGGHSGMDIHSGRANANQLLGRALHAIQPYGPRLLAYTGGRMDNAITREAHATIAVAPATADDVETTIQALHATLQSELASVDDGITLSTERKSPNDSPSDALTDDASKRLIDVLAALPYGVERMSNAAPGVVETSNNIGVAQLVDGRFTAQLLVRSLVDSARDALANRIHAIFSLGAIDSAVKSGYPGWTPDPDADLLSQFEHVHASITGQPPTREVIHAGLECGLIGAKYPNLQMISFGPTIRGAHSPSERVETASVASFQEILEGTIENLATTG